MNIAPDLDRLMWSIADGGDPSAVESFRNRFPELQHELAKRVSLVQSLKHAKQLHVSGGPRPSFTPRRVAHSRTIPSGRTTLGLAFAAGAVLALAGYMGLFSGRRTSSPITVANATVLTAKSAVPAPFLGPVRSQSHVPQKLSAEEGIANGGAGQPPSSYQPSVAPKQVPGSPPANQTVTMKQVPLSTALKAISKQCRIEIETAPKFPDPVIDMNYVDMDGMSILQDLGSKYSFGVVSEGIDKVLLVPQPAGTGP